MITQETAASIYTIYREIEAGKQLLTDMQKELKEWPNKLNKTEPRLRDAFGRRRHLQLGIPSGENSHQLLDIAPALAESIIRAHIANKEAEMVTVQEQAWLESGN